MAGQSPTSEPSASQQGSQCLPPLVDELQIHSMADGDASDSPRGNDKHQSVRGTTSVPNNEPTTADNVRRLRSGRAVVLSGNQRKLGSGDAEKQSSKHNLSPLPCEDNHCAHEQCHTGPTASSQEKTNRQKQPSKQKTNKHSQPPEKGAVYPPRVTRSKTKLMTQNGRVDNEVAPSDAPQGSRDQTMGDTEPHQKTHTSRAQIKYNKPIGCSGIARDANYSTSERQLLTTNNRAKNSIPLHNGCCINGSRKHQQHSTGLSCGEESQPLSDVTNSSCDDIFTDVTRPSFIQSSQTRVYQLVAGKKNKKPRKQQPRKTAMHGKKLSTTGNAEHHLSSDQASASSQGSAQGDNCLRQYHPHKASQHTKTSGENEDETVMACCRGTGICDMFSIPHATTSSTSSLSHHRVFKSNEHESDSNFHTLFQDNSDIFI